jgi:hypothetical protein|tara:strand:+ start:102 stop:791 length:690 start_codon:yes stop_codon:yes gene_type:complete
MNDYTKGILTGASLILCFFMLVSAKSQGENLGHITVEGISVLNKQGEHAIFVGADSSGYILTYNSSGEITVGLGSYKNGAGLISLYHQDGYEAVSIGSDLTRGGISTFNAEGKRTANLGTQEGAGVFTTSNADGQGVVAIGTVNGDGIFSTFNADGQMSVAIGTKEGAGVVATSYPNGKDAIMLSDGALRTYSEQNVLTGYFGTNTENDGMAGLNDRYGDLGWSASGKK